MQLDKLWKLLGKHADVKETVLLCRVIWCQTIILFPLGHPSSLPSSPTSLISPLHFTWPVLEKMRNKCMKPTWRPEELSFPRSLKSKINDIVHPIPCTGRMPTFELSKPHWVAGILDCKYNSNDIWLFFFFFKKLADQIPELEWHVEALLIPRIFFSLFKSLFEESSSFACLFTILRHGGDKHSLEHVVGGHPLKESSSWMTLDVKCNLFLPGCVIFSMPWHMLNYKILKSSELPGKCDMEYVGQNSLMISSKV